MGDPYASVARERDMYRKLAEKLGKKLEMQGMEMEMLRALIDAIGAGTPGLPEGAGPSIRDNAAVLEKWIADDRDLGHAAGDAAKFREVLPEFTRRLAGLEWAPRMRGECDTGGGRGNRSVLPPRYVLLLALMRLRHNTSQRSLARIFGVDQSTVSRHLDLGIHVLDRIKEAEEAEEKAKDARGPDVLLIDGFRTPILRPGDARLQREAYSGKTKSHTYNTVITTDADGMILDCGLVAPKVYRFSRVSDHTSGGHHSLASSPRANSSGVMYPRAECILRPL